MQGKKQKRPTKWPEAPPGGAGTQGQQLWDQVHSETRFPRQRLCQAYTYCRLGKILWGTTGLAEVLTEWPLGRGPGAAVLAVSWWGEGARRGLPNPRDLP